MPLIILEGADLAGKSTLAADLRREFNGPTKLFRQGPPPADVPIRDVYELPWRSYTPNPLKLTVCDRWHLGEMVYGPLLRGESRLTLVERFHLELYLASLGAVLVHVQAPEADLRQRYRTRGDRLVSEEQVLRVAATYRALLGSSALPVLHATSPLNKQQVRLLLSTATTLAASAVLHGPAPYLGRVDETPDLLLVADQPGNGDAPPFPPYEAAGCSRWFMEVAYRLGAHRELNVVNANAVPPEQLERLATRKRQKTVALGRAGAAALDRLGLPHGTVNHPQSWKRSRYHDQAGYQTAIIRAAETQKDLTHHA